MYATLKPKVLDKSPVIANKPTIIYVIYKTHTL